MYIYNQSISVCVELSCWIFFYKTQHRSNWKQQVSLFSLSLSNSGKVPKRICPKLKWRAFLLKMCNNRQTVALFAAAHLHADEQEQPSRPQTAPSHLWLTERGYREVWSCGSACPCVPVLSQSCPESLTLSSPRRAPPAPVLPEQRGRGGERERERNR